LSFVPRRTIASRQSPPDGSSVSTEER
jgi:hypothetical protein